MSLASSPLTLRPSTLVKFCFRIGPEFYQLENIFDNHVSKIFALSMASAFSAAMVPLMIGIIWYEKDNHSRTLINQLLSSLMYWMLIWIIAIQPPTFWILAFGPLSSATFCALHSFIRNAFIIQCLFIQIATLVTRYIFIFHLKNPTALQDDFWNIFINMWAFAWSLLSQFTLYFLPGKHPIHYCICVGQLPLEFDPLVKRNMPILVLGAASVIFYIFVCIRYHNHVTFKFNIKF